MSRSDVTQVLAELTGGDDTAAAQLMALVYEELRALAGAAFRGQPACHTLQPTALVHEAFVRITGRSGVQFKDRAHFFAVCAAVMRSILADYARKRRALKRGGDGNRVSLSGIETPSGTDEIDVLALDEALGRLAALNERQARIVECRCFSGMTVEEVARVLDVSVSTVEADWRMARAWLGVELSRGAAP